MTFKYSICHPNKPNIEYRNNPISGDEVLKIAKEYPWVEKLEILDSLNNGDVCYSPSLDFTSLKNERSFCLTANYDNAKRLEFSLWYNRPKRVKILFGLLGEKEKMVVDDVWSINFDKSIKYLEYFVNGNSSIIEELYNK